MHSGKLLLPGVLVVSLALVTGVAFAATIDPCVSLSTIDNTKGGPSVLFTCPGGDELRSFWNQDNLCAPAGPIDCAGGGLPSFGWSIRVWLKESDGTPIPGVPPEDFWIKGCGTCSPTGFTPPAIIGYCGGGPASSNADSMTNSAGYTTMSQSTFVGGGCSDGMVVVVQGFTLLAPGCITPSCLPIKLRSPDINGDLIVNVQDVGVFASAATLGWHTRGDMNFDGPAKLTNAQDVGIFSFHAATNHNCQ